MSAAGPVASLAMYPLPSLRAATDDVWRAVRRHLGWGPESLEWTTLTPDIWHHPDLVVAQTCGWPLVTELADTVAVVGTFDYVAPGSRDGTYRSVVVTPHAATLDELRERADVVAAVNGFDSLSGWVSLQHAWGGKPPATIETGAHLESVRALQAGRADVASIDAVSWQLFGDVDPALVEGLHVIGAGPRVPCLPVVASWRHAADVPAFRAAFAAAVADRDLADSLALLRIRGFVPKDLSDYLPLRTLLT